MPQILASSKTPPQTRPNSNIYTYPDNLSEYGDDMRIKTYKYVSLSEFFVSTDTPPLIPIPGAPPPSVIKRTPFGEDNGGRGIARERFIKGNVIDIFRLPMPDSIQFDDTIAWNLEDLRTIGRFAPTIAEQFARGGDQTNTAETLASLASSGIPEGIIGIIEGLNVFSSGQAITQGFAGKILNPYHEQIFKGLEPRSFSAKYKLVPRNQIEQRSIYNIIKKLRMNALPNYSRQGLTKENQDNPNNLLSSLGDRWLTTPNVCDVRFMFEGADEIFHLPKLKPMIITGISTNYTPDGAWVTHLTENDRQDTTTRRLTPAPAAIEIVLSFHEVEIITSVECDQGY
jgi:hypothetical protein